jgi:hypothetical protein
MKVVYSVSPRSRQTPKGEDKILQGIYKYIRCDFKLGSDMKDLDYL